MTESEAVKMLPPDAVWSCSFGNAGEGGCVVYYRTPAGERWKLSNGRYDAVRPFNWQCARED